MTQIHFTLDKDELQELISNSGANEASKLILIKLFNELMENQRDEYCNVDPYQRAENVHHKETDIIDEISQRVLALSTSMFRAHVMATSVLIFLNVTSETRKRS